MWYCYTLKSIKNKQLYIGYTGDLKQRLNEHNQGKGGKYTKNNRPWKLIYYEAYLSKRDATKAEKFYKTGYGKEILKNKLKHYLNNVGGSSNGRTGASEASNSGSSPDPPTKQKN